jgi:hypothetical protein
MDYRIQVAAFFQTQWEHVCTLFHRCRRSYLLPYAKVGGRDMVLINSAWFDASPLYPADLVRATYSAERHEITGSGPESRLVRFKWLSAISEGRDLSDFFAPLRLSEGLFISDDALLALYAHQKGYMPVRPLTVVTRDGVESVIGGPDVREPEQLNYIK